MKQWFSRGFCLLVLLLALIPGVGLIFAGPSAAGANEVLHKAPALRNAKGEWNLQVLSDAADWFSDHFFARQEMISLDHALRAGVLHTSGADNVVLGRDGWLYYGDTLGDYQGTSAMTDAQLAAAADNLALMAEYCQANGRKFLLVIAPNKSALYPEHMPFAGSTGPHNAQKLLAALEARKVATADLFSAFANQSECLYFAHDSHWNTKGAALGADVILAAVGEESSYFTAGFSQTTPHQGDLFEMLYPAFSDSEQDFVYNGLEFTYTGKDTRPDSITLTTESGGIGSALVYRDSFGNLLHPFLADHFGIATFSRSTSYDLTREGQTVIVELVERNLDYLLRYVPLMPAPERQAELPPSSGELSVKCSEKSGMLLTEGTLEEDADRVYLICGGVCYEAFRLADGKFAAYLPEAPQQAAYLLNGVWTLYDIT